MMADEMQTEQVEPLVWMGGEVKALGNGRVGGYLVRFGSAEQTDTTGEYFDAQTDFGPIGQTGIFYQHGFSPKVGRRRIGLGTMKADDVGIWIDGQIELHDRYIQAVYAAIEKGKMGWSSGTAPHLIERVPMGKAVYLSRWLLGVDASLTPTPAEPRNTALPLKAWLGSVNLEALAEAGGESAPDAGEAPETDTKSMATEKPTLEVEVHQMDENEVKAVVTATVKSFWDSIQTERDVTPIIGRVTSGGDEADRAAKGNPFKSFGEMSMAVKSAGQSKQEIDKRLLPIESPDGYEIPKAFTKAVSGMSEGTPASGGFLVGTDERLQVPVRDWAVGSLLSRVTMTPVGAGSNSMTFNFEAETSRADGYRRGGVRGYWAAEAGDKTKSNPTFRQATMKLKKAVALVYATDELMADATALESYLLRVYPEELQFLVEDSIINGNGVGQPLGFLAGGGTYSVAKETGQAAATIVTQNIIKMWSHRYVAKSDYAWYYNQEVEAQLMQMTLGVGVGGIPTYMPPGGLSQAPYGSIFGRPCYPVEYCAALGTVGDIMLISPSSWQAIYKGGTESASSIHYRFVNDETVWRFVLRVDGQPEWLTALTPYKGTASSISPCVTLATRA
jgi:HK97 family phage major capsid protein